MSRKSTGKRLRFEVFKRDGFTCRYCGAQPPDVVLVVDHIIPVAEGGSSTIENLNTACESCNQGKAAKPLTSIAPRPDADLLYLETMQEAAELRRYHKAIADKENAQSKLVEAMQATWGLYTDVNWVPSDHVLHQMLNKYDPEIVAAGIRDVAPKVDTGFIRGNYVPYMWAVLRNIATGDPDDAEHWEYTLGVLRHNANRLGISLADYAGAVSDLYQCIRRLGGEFAKYCEMCGLPASAEDEDE